MSRIARLLTAILAVAWLLALPGEPVSAGLSDLAGTEWYLEGNAKIRARGGGKDVTVHVGRVAHFDVGPLGDDVPGGRFEMRVRGSSAELTIRGKRRVSSWRPWRIDESALEREIGDFVDLDSGADDVRWELRRAKFRVTTRKRGLFAKVEFKSRWYAFVRQGDETTRVRVKVVYKGGGYESD